MPLRVVRNTSLNCSTKRAFGSRAYEIHVAANDVDELRQLVKPQLANDAAHARDARVVTSAQTGPESFSAPMRIERNLMILKVPRCMPTRSCV